jgi:Ca2+-transporting ATPase
MITGDHAATAQTIAQRAGLEPGDCLAGVELDALTDAQLAERIADVSVFARVLPTQKLRIVRALQATGAVVAMTGDGVNDAPALKAADIGIAMGLRGSDVAREAASLVLMQDDFGSIVKTMRLGRRIYDNLRKAMGFIISVHVPIAGLALLPLLTGEQIILAPAHIAFLEMVIDPTCSIAFEAEPEEPGLMRRPPRHLDEPLFYRGWVLFSLARGTAVLIVVIGIHEIAGRSGLTTDQSRSATFVALVLSMLALLETSRRFREPQFRQSPAAARPGRTGARNGPALAIMLVVICCTAVAALVHPAEQLFGFGELSRFGVLLALGGAGLSYLVLATGLGHPSQARSEKKQG